MTREEMVANALLAFSAGFDTTAITISLAVFHLARESEWQEKIRAEVKDAWNEPNKYESLCQLKFLDMFVNETLRLYPPAPAFVTRTAATDYSFGEFVIPKDMTVQAPLQFLHRNAEYVQFDTWQTQNYQNSLTHILIIVLFLFMIRLLRNSTVCHITGPQLAAPILATDNDCH